MKHSDITRRAPAAALVVCFVLAIATYVAFAIDLQTAKKRVAHDSRIVQTSFGAVEYAAKGEGPPVLVIHGASGGFDQGMDMVGSLAAEGYRVVAPSRFGYLRSAMPAHPTTAMQADALVELLDHLQNRKAVIIGISAGAWSALQIAIRHPDRCAALVLLVPADNLPPGVAIHGGVLADAIFHSDFMAWAAIKAIPLMPGKLTTVMLGTNDAVVRAASPAEKQRVQQTLDHLLPLSARYRGTQFDIKTAAIREKYALDRITCPVLAISAADDAFHTDIRARDITGHVKDGKAVIFPTGGHALVGRYDEALKTAVHFLRAKAQY